MREREPETCFYCGKVLDPMEDPCGASSFCSERCYQAQAKKEREEAGDK